MFKKNILFFLLFISIILILIFLSYIYSEFRNFSKINKNINFYNFVKINIIEVLKFDFENKRIKNLNLVNNLIKHDQNFIDKGYLLVSGYDIDYKTAKTNLISLETGDIIYSWSPPISEIHKNSPSFLTEYNLKQNYRMQHPLILDNGDLIFSSGEGPLVKIDKCGELLWSIDRHFHHSIEFYDNNSIIVPIIINKNTIDEIPILDHGFAIIDLDTGKIKKEFSVFKLLQDNNEIGLLYGVGEFEYDRIHLNDAESIKVNDKYFKKGDIMLSSKHLSTVLLYRPSSNKIIWIKTGPWLNQHDVDYLGMGKFSIFGNDTFRYDINNKYDIFYDESNKIYIYDFIKDSISTIYDNEMKDIKTPTQGLHEILKNNDVFIEDTDNFRLIRLGANGKRWEYYNIINDDKIGSIHWSRYLDDKSKFDWLIGKECNNN